MREANIAVLLLSLASFGLLSTGIYLTILPLNIGTLFIVLAFVVLGMIIGAVLFIPKDAFKEPIKEKMFEGKN